LQTSGQLERLVRSGARFATKAMVLSAARNDAAIEIAGHVDLGSTAHPQVATNLIAGTGSPFDQLAVEVISPD
jgi:hypothetical protein